MRNKNTRKGFTTVELVIVIAVIAILATVLIPTFSNMIEKANLSVDTQNVRNMNVCLATYSITDGNPSDFGKVKEELKEYGYGKDDNFIPKSKGYTISWYTDDKNDNDKSNDISVIVLVDDKNKVVYPEDYEGIDASDIRMFFDLSLPASLVEKDDAPDAVVIGGINMELAVGYTFTANTEVSINYNDWYADYFVAIDLPENKQKADIILAGFYEEYCGVNGEWIYLPLIDFVEEVGYVPLVNRNLTYADIQTSVGEFQCGILKYNDLFPSVCGDTYDDPTGAVMTVELRLTNPDDANDQVVIGIFNYTFQ